MACPSSREDFRRTGLAGYLRKPDADFWLKLLRPPPAGGEKHVQRRERITRYSLGAATVAGVLYAVLALIMAPDQFMPGIVINLAAAGSYAIGMWKSRA